MKFVYCYNTKDNERREGLTVSAPNRDAAYTKLNRQGIKPFKLYPAPGLANRLSALGWRWTAIFALGAALLAACVVALRQHRDIVAIGKAEEAVEIVNEAIASKVRRQLIGDQGLIDRGVRTGWRDVFTEEGERFLASFALPGVPATVRTTNVAALEDALKRKVEVSESDGIEVRQIKAMVEGMKDELRGFVRAGGTIEQYGRRLVARQDEEIAIYGRTVNEIEQAAKSGAMGRDDLERLVDSRNDELRRMGIKAVPMPETE